MTCLYIFGNDGWCISVSQMRDVEDALFYVEGARPRSYIISDVVVPLERARLVAGALVNQERQRTLDDQWAAIRGRRSGLLSQSDWSVLPDVPMTVERRQQWGAYRQALRDITEHPDPFNIVWPAPPQ